MFDAFAALPVVPFTDPFVPNLDPFGDVPWQRYHEARNAVVRACRRHGPTGPTGVIKLDADVPDPYRRAYGDPSFWERGDPNPVYYVLDDQYTPDRYCYIEFYGRDPLTPEWLASVVAALREFDGWGLGVHNLVGGYLLIFGDRLMVKGRLARCRTATEVATTARRLFRRQGTLWWRSFESAYGVLTRLLRR